MKKILALLCSILVAALHLAAADETLPASPLPALPLFRPNELSIDLYSTYTAAEPDGIAKLLDTSIRHGKFGAGLGATYWLTRNFGAGLEVAIPEADEIHGALFDQVSLSFAARLPLGNFAPYSFGGLGRDFENSRWNTHAGLGLEWRFHPRAAAFVDARYVFASHETDSLMMRAGVRFPF